MHNDVSIPFDQYQRYGVAVRIIEAVRKHGQPLSILEVGANTHKLLGRLLPNDRIVYLDREIPVEMRQQEDIVVDDATDLSLPDESFDVVVALDVFEHIPKERRDAFLMHVCRTSRLISIIGAPFNLPATVRAEQEAMGYWEGLTDSPYRWLAEHAENGLPDLESTIQNVQSMGYNGYVLRHGDIKLWTDFIKAHFAEVHVGSLQPIMAVLYQYYQQHLFEQDFSPRDSYRQFVLSSRDASILQTIRDIFEEKASAVHDGSTLPLQILKLLAPVATEVAQRAEEIAERDKAIQELNGTVQHLNGVIRELDGRIQSIYESSSWRMMAPMRVAGRQARRAKRIFELAKPAITQGGGVKSTLKKAADLYRREGWSGIRRGFRMVAASSQQHNRINGTRVWGQEDYNEWVRRYDTLNETARSAMRVRMDAFACKPLISVTMPTYNPKPEWLRDAIESVRNQIYPHWELCIADDASTDQAIRPLLEEYAKADSRIKVVFREQNGHISAASNSALEKASGEWVALLDHDDVLPEQALFWVVDAINRHPSAQMIYSDEDKIDAGGRRFSPYFKCDWNLELFYAQNMFSHLGVYKTALLRDIGGFRVGFEGSQDYDLALRCVERINEKEIVHIPRVLYHWRVHANSTAQSAGAKPYAVIAGEKALQEHFHRQKIAASVERGALNMRRVRFHLPQKTPLVSLIIPTRNGLHLIRQCITSIIDKTTYANYEIIIIDNGSDDPAVLEYFKALGQNPRIHILRDDRPFNYSALNNFAVQHAQGEIVGLINNDIEVISPEWLSEMVSITLRPEVGAVGAKLWYPDKTLQHGGVLLGIGGVANHAHYKMPDFSFGYFGRAAVTQEFSAVTAACLLVRKSVYEEVGGLNEHDLKIAFNDIDFCLRVKRAGYKNIWTPYSELYHHESASRGAEDTPEKQARFVSEVNYMTQTWKDELQNDSAYNPNLSLEIGADFNLAWPPRVESLSELPTPEAALQQAA